MEYATKARHGDIGEHLVAFRIMKLIGWPCRLFGIDLGVDAEVEILSDKDVATGDVIKLQVKSVKSTGAGDKFEIYTSEDHIKYWTRFSAPVVFCGVDLATETVYWKQITALDSYDTTGASKKVTFSKATDVLSAATKATWLSLSSPLEAHQLSDLMEQYKACVTSTEHGAGDLYTVAAYEKHFAIAAQLEKTIDSLISVIPWKMTGTQLAAYTALKRDMRRRKNENDRAGSEMPYY